MRRSYVTLAVVCSGWGSIPLLVRHIALPPAAIVFIRVWVAAAGLAVVLRVAPTLAPGPRLFSHRPGRTLAAGVLLAVHWTAMFAGYQRAPDDTVVFVVFLAPVGIALLAPRALGERVGGRAILALAGAVVGFALIAAPNLEAANAAGIAFAGLSAATFIFLVLVSKSLAEVYGGLRLTLQEMLVAGVVLLPVAVTARWGRPEADWALLAVLGLVHTAIGITLYLTALARIPATSIGILGYLEPVSVVVLSWLFFGDRPLPTTVIGGALIIVAGAIVITSDPGDATQQGGRVAISVPR